MTTTPPNLDEIQRALAKALHENWHWLLVEGIVLIVLGAAAIAIPPLATLAIALFIGWLILISGIVGLVSTLRLRGAPGFWWSLLSAILGIVVGVLLIGWPVNAVLSLTLLLIVFFAIEGVVSIMYALEHRQELGARRGWMIASGVVDLVLSAIIFAGLPGAAAWAIGLIVGINLVFGGAALVAMALHARTLGPGAGA